MDHLALDDDVRARESDALSLELELRKDEMRRRRADVDADGPKPQPLRRDVARIVIWIVRVAVVLRVTRMRGGQRALDADRELVHPHLDTVRSRALDVGAMDGRILVLVLDLVAALVDVLVDALVV